MTRAWWTLWLVELFKLIVAQLGELRAAVRPGSWLLYNKSAYFTGNHGLMLLGDLFEIYSGVGQIYYILLF